MILATRLMSMMSVNATKTARNKRRVSLQRNVRRMEDCTNVVSEETRHFVMSVDIVVVYQCAL